MGVRVKRILPTILRHMCRVLACLSTLQKAETAMMNWRRRSFSVATPG